MRGRILVVDHKTPMPDQDSGSASTFSVLSILARAGLDVTFAPFDLRHAGSYTKAINKLGIETLAEPNWASMYDVIETIGPRSDLLLLYRAPVATQLFDRARSAAPSTKILFHPVDLHFLRMQREAALSHDQPGAQTAEKMRSIELDLVRRADSTIVVSAHEARLLQAQLPEAVIHHIPILRETPPVGARGRSFLERLVGRKPTPKGRRDILFLGGYEHTPNVDAVKWFVREVWPLVQASGFSERLIIAGSKTPDEIAALACEQIEVRGYVKDLVPLFAACRLSIAPLRYGGGVKGKIVTSLSHGVPVVATSIAAEGMGLRHGEDVLIADDPAAMADQIKRLYSDAALWAVLSLQGYEAFQSKFSIKSGTGKVLSVIDGLLGANARQPAAR